MIVFYLDEAGDPNPHHEPLLDGETPLFCLSGVPVHSSRWRELDRSLLNLKHAYFRPEIARFVAKHPSLRSEYYEVKGRELFKPSNARQRRARVFAHKALDLGAALDTRLFAAVWKKSASTPTDPIALYTHCLQVLTERFHYYCEQLDDTGIMVIDARRENLNFQVAASQLSYLFGHALGRTFTRLIEAPMFVDSKLSAGVQLADIIGGCIYGYYFQRKCHALAGCFDGPFPVTPRRFLGNPSGPWILKTPARDYGHCRPYWSRLDGLQFKRSCPPPRPGFPVSGYYGFRELGEA